MGVRASRVCVSVCVCECVCDCVSSVLLCVFIARVSTLRLGRPVLVTPSPLPPAVPYLLTGQGRWSARGW